MICMPFVANNPRVAGCPLPTRVPGSQTLLMMKNRSTGTMDEKKIETVFAEQEDRKIDHLPAGIRDCRKAPYPKIGDQRVLQHPRNQDPCLPAGLLQMSRSHEPFFICCPSSEAITTVHRLTLQYRRRRCLSLKRAGPGCWPPMCMRMWISRALPMP